LISFQEAQAIIAAVIPPRPTRSCALESAAGAVSAGEIISSERVPPFANAAMDGFAVRTAELATASDSAPLELAVAATAAAGSAPMPAPPPGGVVEIMTGAAMPADCDAVVPVERTEHLADGRIRFSAQASPGQNVRLAGSDIRPGNRLVEAGTRLAPQHIMGLAAAGVVRVDVRTAPRVAIITTGAELVAGGSPLRAGMIRDANGPYLQTVIGRIGAQLAGTTSVADELEALTDTLRQGAGDADVLVTTGGVSAGRFDVVPEAVRRAGGQVRFHKVAIRPGKPVLFATLPGDRCFFGLPGNPIAVAVGLRFFVVPALRVMQGLPPEAWHSAVAELPVRKRAGLLFFGKARARVDGDGRMLVQVLPGQESFRIAPLMDANCWAIVPDSTEMLDTGGLLQVAPLYPTDFLQAAG